MEVSRGTADALVASIIKSLRIASSGGINSELLILLIRSFGYLKGGILKGRVKAIDLDGIDIFTPLLKCDSIEGKLDFAAILVAYFSINKELQPLITTTIERWYNLMPQAERDDPEFRPGYFTIVSEFGIDEKIERTLARLSKFNLAGVLVNSWVPQWLSFVIRGECIPETQVSKLDLTSLVLFEHSMDFYIATMDFSFLNSECMMNRSYESPEAYFYSKVCQRLILFPGWIDKPPYRMISKFLLSSGNKSQDGKLNDVSFCLEVLLDIVDHPDINYLEEPKLATFLFLSLKKIYQTPCNKLHSRLESLGTTQSLTALLSMVQYLLSKFLINMGSVSELAQATKMDVQLMQGNDEKNWYKSGQDAAKLPAWFETSILPPTAPIPKSSFVYDKGNWPSHGSDSALEISDMLIDSLNTILLINAKILTEYGELGINTLAINDEGDEAHEVMSKIKHKLTKQYMLLYLIPLFSALMLSNQLSYGSSEIYNAKKYHLKGNTMFLNSVKLCKKILQAHTGIALYHLIDFISRISLESLLMHSVAVDILNCLLFKEEDNFVKALVLKNQLSQQALQVFVNDWDDGSEKYKLFHEKLFSTKQAVRRTNMTTVLDLIKLLPDHEAILLIVRQNKPNIENQIQVLSNQDKRKPAPRTNSYIQGSKFDPYSATSFVPASKIASNTVKELPTFIEHASPQKQRQITPDHWPNFLADRSTGPLSDDHLNMYASGNCVPANTPLTNQTQHTLNIYNISSPTSTPNTPNVSTSTIFSNPWDGSPSIHSTPNVSKTVNTGKNYILGGHNRVKNNSRAQSIHIDNFEQNQ